jgi:hypothetical protein
MSVKCFHINIGSWIRPNKQTVYLGSSPFKQNYYLIVGLFSLGHFFSHFYDTTLDFCKMVIPDSRKNIKLIKVLEDHALFNTNFEENALFRKIRLLPVTEVRDLKLHWFMTFVYIKSDNIRGML